MKNKIESKNRTMRNKNNNSKILGERNYQTSPEASENPKILGGGSYQTSPKNNFRIAEGSFLVPLAYSDSVYCEEEVTRLHYAMRHNSIQRS